MEVSMTSMNVASITETAISHGLTAVSRSGMRGIHFGRSQACAVQRPYLVYGTSRRTQWIRKIRALPNWDATIEPSLHAEDSLVHLALRPRGNFGNDRRPLGHFLAPLNRASHVLDSGAYRNPVVRRDRRHHLRLPDSLDHFHAVGTARGLGQCARLPRTAGRVHLRLGRLRDDRLGAL